MAQETEPSGSGGKPGDRKASGKTSETRSQTAKSSDDADRARSGDGDTDESGNDADGFARLREGHKTLRALIGECEKADEGKAEDLLLRMAAEWAQHGAGHAALFDCATEAGLDEFAPLNEGAIETDLVSFLLRRAGRELHDAMQLAGLRVAARMIGTIIETEEKPRSGILAKVKGAGVDPGDLSRRIDACSAALPRGAGANRPQLRHLTVNQEDIMPRNMPERDDEGRFVSDRDHRNRAGGSGRSHDGYGRGRRDHDDDRRYASRGSRYDDDDRRYSSYRDDDYRRGGGRSYGRSDYGYEEDDRGYSRDRGQGGWFGDPEGHSEASRRGWAHRDDDDHYARGHRGRSRYDDDDRRYSSYRDDDYRRGGGRSYGRSDYGYEEDDRGYSRDRGQGGWFGDPEGHSEASERGWERRRHEGDDRGYSRRGRR